MIVVTGTQEPRRLPWMKEQEYVRYANRKMIETKRGIHKSQNMNAKVRLVTCRDLVVARPVSFRNGPRNVLWPPPFPLLNIKRWSVCSEINL